MGTAESLSLRQNEREAMVAVASDSGIVNGFLSEQRTCPEGQEL